MTLIVVDSKRIVADSYATVFEGGEIKIMNDFPKIFSLPFKFILPNGKLTYPRMAFVGNAHEFYKFYTDLMGTAVSTNGVVPVSLLMDKQHNHRTHVFQIIIPIEGGAISVMYGNGKDATINQHIGHTLGFGGDYDLVKTSGLVRPNSEWKEIFQLAIENGILAGGSYHTLEHSTSLEHQIPYRGELEFSNQSAEYLIEKV